MVHPAASLSRQLSLGGLGTRRSRYAIKADAEKITMSQPADSGGSSAHWRKWLLHALGFLYEQGRRLVQTVIAWMPWRLLFLVLLAAVLLHWFKVYRIPFWPFTTAGGRIYVDSPEVYTRERLVNDRYDQDWWLRKQLASFNDIEFDGLVGKRVTQDADVQAAAPGQQAPVTSGAASHTDFSREGLEFRDGFEVVSGIRDMIRQRILENMLDDRHDLTANSVFGLKFDTTVIPGGNTRDRAFVQVKLQPDWDFARSGPGWDERPPEHLCVFAGGAQNFADDALNKLCFPADLGDAETQQQRIEAAIDRYDKQMKFYNLWLVDLEKRLNLMEDSLFESLYESTAEKSRSVRAVNTTPRTPKACVSTTC
jgi:hypothetical protein